MGKGELVRHFKKAHETTDFNAKNVNDVNEVLNAKVNQT
jgi:hypothetical protein